VSVTVRFVRVIGSLIVMATFKLPQFSLKRNVDLLFDRWRHRKTGSPTPPKRLSNSATIMPR